MMKRKYLSPRFYCQRFSIKNNLLSTSSEDMGDDLWGDGDGLFDEDVDVPEVPKDSFKEDVDGDD